jgi:hypothetical protein
MFARLLCLCLVLTVSPIFAAEDQSPMALPKVDRKPVVDRVMVFPRIRTIYNLYRNFFQNFNEYQWIDRPLFYDRSLDTPDTINMIIQNNKRQMDIAAAYDVDGFSMLYHGTLHEERFRNMIDVADLNYQKTGGKLLLSVIGNVLQEGPEKAAEIFEPVLNRYISSVSAARVGDKVLLASYSTDYVSPEDVNTFLNILRKRCGDRFLFVASIGQPKGIRLNNWPRFGYEYHKNHGKIPADELKAVQDHLRSYLAVCDGILMNNANHIDTIDHQLDVDFYRNFIVPLYAGVLAEPQAKGKLLGLSASLGYINHIAGGTQLEDGTRALRESLDIALNSGADFIVMPEWNEYNENTCLEPTVVRGQSTQRIMRYTMQTLKHPRRFEPLEGDDQSIPNLIVSARAQITLGQTYYVELLNVPDTLDHHAYTVTCIIRDENGKAVYQHQPVKFDTARLTEQRIEIASQTLASCRTLMPELHITQENKVIAVKQGLPVTQLSTTWNQNRMCIKRCLRDLPDEDTLKVTKTFTDNGKALMLHVQAQAQSKNDPIRYLEVIEDDTVVYAHDVAGQLETADDEVLVHLFYDSKNEIKPLSLEVDVEHGQITYFEDRLRIRSARESHWSYTPPIKMNWKSNFNRRGALIKINHKDTAVLSVRSNKFDQDIKISDLIKQRQFMKNYDGNLTMVVEIADRALDIPLPNDQEQLSFTRTFLPRNQGAVFCVRSITRSGRIMTSAPIAMPLPDDSQQVTLQVHSQQQGRVIPIQVLASRCPNLVYTFDPSKTGRLETDAGRRWQATFAGGWAWGRAMSRTQLPKQSINAAPQWVKDAGMDCLSFDGQSHYCNFPSETIPAHGPFTIAMQIKPLTIKKQYLIHSQNAYLGTVDLVLEPDGVSAVYRGQMKVDEEPYFTSIPLKVVCDVPVNQWTTVTLSYDLEHLVLQVGDAKPVRVACDRVAWWPLSEFTLGGWGPDSSMYYHGLIRSMTVKHSAAPRLD